MNTYYTIIEFNNQTDKSTSYVSTTRWAITRTEHDLDTASGLNAFIIERQAKHPNCVLRSWRKLIDDLGDVPVIEIFN